MIAPEYGNRRPLNGLQLLLQISQRLIRQLRILGIGFQFILILCLNPIYGDRIRTVKPFGKRKMILHRHQMEEGRLTRRL
ncbi:hypothetical protein D3C73_1544600 [compost metagenome]